MTATATATAVPQGTAPTRDRPAPLPVPRWAWVAVVVLVAAIAFWVRIGLLLRGGGLLGSDAYDDGVYYAGAAAFAHGRVPYLDFLFLQPPGIMVLLGPFAALGAVVTDARAMALARVSFELVGALNAVIVMVLARRWGFGAALIAGVTYAVFFPNAYTERSTTLEPIGTLGILLALLLARRAAVSPAWALLAGACAALAVSMKVWYIIPAAIVLAFQPARRLQWFLGLVGGGVALYVPFLLAAPGPMLQQVVLDQLGRPRPGTLIGSLKKRVLGLSGAPTLHGSLAWLTPSRIALTVFAIGLLLAIGAALVRGARVYVVLSVVTALVIIASPSYFTHYVSFVTPWASVMVGVGAARWLRPIPIRAVRAVGVVVLLVLVVALDWRRDAQPIGERIPLASLRPAAAQVRGCITTDDPVILASMNVLTRDLERGCPLWPDVTGWTYDRDDVRKANGQAQDRPKNLRWQHDLLVYLRSGDATIVARQLTGLSPESKAVLERGRVLGGSGGFLLRTTP
ncbi:hypothetical protein QDR37_16030 [Amnibacterium sp. CER49]|uniref:hypothetical protein n=1 Tax=Amnibacterium sp. CER49 TaxID=3039161 RepID=UPI00244819A5|nr:hypothetical protein [Amnibacterium sp. CER49]MDH2445456.1 hypothetical protein [Amnibacterium sp. CER49]